MCSLVEHSAHRLTERIIRVKFNETCLKGSRDIEQTPNLRVKPMTFNFDVDLESVKLSFKLCTPTH